MSTDRRYGSEAEKLRHRQRAVERQIERLMTQDSGNLLEMQAQVDQAVRVLEGPLVNPEMLRTEQSDRLQPSVEAEDLGWGIIFAIQAVPTLRKAVISSLTSISGRIMVALIRRRKYLDTARAEILEVMQPTVSTGAHVDAGFLRAQYDYEGRGVE